MLAYLLYGLLLVFLLLTPKFFRVISICFITLAFANNTKKNVFVYHRKQGITYSIISASWDEDREGSFLGTDEFKKNIGSIQDGLSRSKDNLLLREKMAGLGESEIESAISDMDRRDKKGQSFQSKMGDELDK